MLEKTLDGKTPIAKSYSYQSYMKLIQDLHLEKKATSFQENEEFFNYSKLNFSRMSRVHKKVKLTQAITNQVESFTSYQKWMLITESWCGDAAQTVPIIARLADLNPLIDFHIILRDSNEELMENYLTNGSKSIPILAILNDQNEEIGKWGPRPHPAQEKVLAYKAMPEPKPDYNKFSQDLQMWYNKDQGKTTQNELLDLLVNLKG